MGDIVRLGPVHVVRPAYACYVRVAHTCELVLCSS